MQIALDKLFGVRGEFRKVRRGDLIVNEMVKKFDGAVPAFRGIREAYDAFSGGHDPQSERYAGTVTTLSGSLGPQSERHAGRVTEEWSSAGFPDALANTLHRRMIQDYQEVDYGLDLLVPPREPHRVALKDFRTHYAVRVGYLGDLSQNDPEAADWPEILAPTDEQVPIEAVQFGNLLTVTRKTVINDDVGLVARAASRLGRAARRTLAQQVMN